MAAWIASHERACVLAVHLAMRVFASASGSGSAA